MLHLLTSTALGLVLVCQLPNAKKSDREQHDFTGRVRNVREERAARSEEGGKLAEGKRELIKTTSFDRAGRITIETFYQDGKIWYRNVYAYDFEGNRTKTVYDVPPSSAYGTAEGSSSPITAPTRTRQYKE